MIEKSLATDGPGSAGGPGGFAAQLEACVQGLRGSLVGALAQLGADPASPRGLARILGLDKTLAWKLSKIARAPRAAAAVPHVPGPGGVRLLLAALKRSGVDRAAGEAVRRAFAEFDSLVALHAGDRATLAAMVEGADEAGGLASRKLSFQGNSATWGIRARTHFGAQFIAPSRDRPGRADIAALAGLVDLRRLRPEARWPLIFHVPYGEGMGLGAERPIDEAVQEDAEPPLLRRFCSDPLPAIEAVPVPGGTLFELSQGPVGNTAAFTCAFGFFARAHVLTHRTPGDEHAEHFLVLTTPCEVAQIDLFVHRELPFELPPELLVLSRMELGVDLPPAIQRRYRLPLDRPVQALGQGLTVAASAHVPRYLEMLGAVYERVGWEPEEFRGFRVELAFPPIPTVPMLRYPLL